MWIVHLSLNLSNCISKLWGLKCKVFLDVATTNCQKQMEEVKPRNLETNGLRGQGRRLRLAPRKGRRMKRRNKLCTPPPTPLPTWSRWVARSSSFRKSSEASDAFSTLLNGNFLFITIFPNLSSYKDKWCLNKESSRFPNCKQNCAISYWHLKMAVR